jgi:hypothetical protein
MSAAACRLSAGFKVSGSGFKVQYFSRYFLCSPKESNHPPSQKSYDGTRKKRRPVPRFSLRVSIWTGPFRTRHFLCRRQ